MRPIIVGVGALNVDYIATASRLSKRMAERITESTARFDWNREGPVEEGVISTAVENLGAASLSYSLGGSAWLTIYTLAHMEVGARLGYVGVAGRIEAPGLSFFGQMDQLGIDRTQVARRPDSVSGMCLSFIDDTDRVMLIHPGANFDMHRHIEENFDEIAGYLADARFVHITSFLDDRTPEQLLKVLTEARRRNPGLRVSFDPGFDWAEHPSDSVRGLLAFTDMLFVNYREFKAIGKYVHAEPDESIARKVLARCRPGCTVFVTKRYDFVEVFRSRGQAVATQQFQLERPVRETEVEDATGAGDVFSAAVLASLTSRRLQVELGAYLGLDLARHKLKGRKGVRNRALPDLSNGFLHGREMVAAVDVRPSGVAVMQSDGKHGPAVRGFLTDRCRLPTYDLRSSQLSVQSAAQVLEQHLELCGFAVCLLSARKVTSRQHADADQNMVYQAGLFQGRYGFGRVALLVEQGCDTFSNIAGLIRLDFPRGRVETVFIELERMLQREGFLIHHGGLHG